MRLAWATDIHLDCVSDLNSCIEDIEKATTGCEGLILSGDISVSPLLIDHLVILDDTLKKPIYFVLGNHDYYFSDIISTKRKVVNVCRDLSFARYLQATSYVKLSKDVTIVGADGWYDGLNGDVTHSQVIMNDWLKIKDFQPSIFNSLSSRTINKNNVLTIARSICQSSVQHIFKSIKLVAEFSKHIIVVTHVPPFVESFVKSKFKDTESNDSFITPWYTSKLMGDMLRSAAKAYPDVQFTVLSGHTHGDFEGNILDNLHIKVGKSQYGSPQISRYINI